MLDCTYTRMLKLYSLSTTRTIYGVKLNNYLIYLLLIWMPTPPYWAGGDQAALGGVQYEYCSAAVPLRYCIQYYQVLLAAVR